MSRRALRLMAIRQAGVEPLALSASGRERMVYGPMVASEENRVGNWPGLSDDRRIDQEAAPTIRR